MRSQREPKTRTQLKLLQKNHHTEHTMEGSQWTLMAPGQHGLRPEALLPALFTITVTWGELKEGDV